MPSRSCPCESRPWAGFRTALGLCLLLLPCVARAGDSYRSYLLSQLFLPNPAYCSATQKPTPNAWSPEEITATWIGHATVLLNVYGTTILTDPMLTKRLGLNPSGHWTIGLRRMSELPLRPQELPKIDIILLSHAHRDHWDLPSLTYFNAGSRAVIPSGCRDLLPACLAKESVELDWGDQATIGEVTLTAVQVRHWGARNGHDSVFRGYNGYVIECRGRRLFFAGDTAFMPDLDARLKGAAMDLCLMPIGAYDPWPRNHAAPEEAWEMFQQARGSWFLPIHWRTFQLSREPLFEPLARLLQAAGSDADKVICREPGATFVLPASPGHDSSTSPESAPTPTSSPRDR